MEEEVLECAMSGCSADDTAGGEEVDDVWELPFSSWWTQVLAEHPLTKVKDGELVKRLIKDILNESAANRAAGQGGASELGGGGGGWSLVAVVKRGYMVVTVFGLYVPVARSCIQATLKELHQARGQLQSAPQLSWST